MTDKRWALAYRWGAVATIIGVAVNVTWLRSASWTVVGVEQLLFALVGGVLGLVLALRLELRRKVRESVMIDGEWVKP